MGGRSPANPRTAFPPTPTYATMRRILPAAGALLLGCVLFASRAEAQSDSSKTGAPRRRGVISIVAQLPTPQVTTIRPRALPDYDRSVLSPAFFDRHFDAM